MSIEDLEKMFAEEDKPAASAKPEEKKPEDDAKKAVEDKKSKDKEHLANIRKAIAEANEELRLTRQKTKAAKKPSEQKVVDEDDELPKINLEDPSAKAWDKHLERKVAPLNDEAAKEKEEVRTFALQEFLADKPMLAKDPEKLKRLMGTYEKIRTATERNREGVLIDLRKAFAAEFYEEALRERSDKRVSRARADAIFSDVAVSRGSTAYNTDRELAPELSSEDVQILAKWGMTPEAYAETLKKQRNQSSK